ncbi:MULTISPECIES: YtfJ family protein [Tatumella]|uniref:YtfJ family protein n=1 Tax=Tatumella punctata TaxID=399969 RepID=A0ABW1VSM5_9GAMM|nr:MULTISPECIES: YtfJ family protein [unclassified Tatumella]MBS0856050.1 YtfJ family protein [Tatumella sp. JGM16]MBS0878109.1 YtfJ family protein [Tatumella sp. JGM82]MBS0890468.1 YtfJ family protein [Tatumella sp. JGM94]MBS0895159.1 YtfJ family protein [Tatumella sp. JGM130]MBS0900924.1 YtfJ family protein [Tatumella sp. JGM100]
MTLFRYLILLPWLIIHAAAAHNLVYGQPVAPLQIRDRGQLVVSAQSISYRPWDSGELAGKVRVVLVMAGRSTVKHNDHQLMIAVKHARFPVTAFQPVIIVNMDDTVPGTGYFVRRKIEKLQQRYPWALFVIDNDGQVGRRWQLKADSSALVVLDKGGLVRRVEEGPLTAADSRQVFSLLQQLVAGERQEALKPRAVMAEKNHGGN